MIRQFWIWFYAVALVLLTLLFLALTLLWLSAFHRFLVFELCIVVPAVIWGWVLWVTYGLLKRELARGSDRGTDQVHQESQQEPDPRRYGEWRAAAVVVLVLAAIIFLLWAVNRSPEFPFAFIAVFCISAPFASKLIGPATYVQVDSPTFERRIQSRYRSEFDQLTQIGFKPLLIFGESSSLFRLLLIYPVFHYAIMLLNRRPQP